MNADDTSSGSSRSPSTSSDLMSARSLRTFARAPSYLWAGPTTIVGLLLAAGAVLTGGRISAMDGVLEVHGGLARQLLAHMIPIRGGGAAIALGHVVLGRDPECLARTRTHERAHVRQCEVWGPLFLPAYLVASGVAWLRGHDPYVANWFERRARTAEAAVAPITR